MNWKWRALVGALLVSAIVIWLPMAVSTSAETRYDTASTIALSPASDNADNSSSDNSSSDNSSGDNGNTNDNTSGNNNNNDNSSSNNNNNDNVSEVVAAPTPTPVNTAPAPNPGDLTGARQQNGALTIDLGRTADKPVVNMPFQITITGSGAPIDQLSWWADNDGPDAGPNNDDMAHVGTSSYACNGSQPCSSGWTIQGRNVGFYTIHAQVRDTSGNVVQTDWQFLVSENARN
jgi:hypothetical protein